MHSAWTLTTGTDTSTWVCVCVYVCDTPHSPFSPLPSTTTTTTHLTRLPPSPFTCRVACPLARRRSVGPSGTLTISNRPREIQTPGHSSVNNGRGRPRGPYSKQSEKSPRKEKASKPLRARQYKKIKNRYAKIGEILSTHELEVGWARHLSAILLP